VKQRVAWSVRLNCPSCGRNGVASLSDQVPPEDQTFQVERVGAGFKMEKLGQTVPSTIFACTDCSVPAKTLSS
jgi:hypothetical protein